MITLTHMPSFHIWFVIALLITNSQNALMGVVRSKLIWGFAGASPVAGVGGVAWIYKYTGNQKV